MKDSSYIFFDDTYIYLSILAFLFEHWLLRGSEMRKILRQDISDVKLCIHNFPKGFQTSPRFHWIISTNTSIQHGQEFYHMDNTES